MEDRVQLSRIPVAARVDVGAGERSEVVVVARDLLEPAKLVPDQWVRSTWAVGSVDECVQTLQAFKDVERG